MSYTDFDFPHTSLYRSDLREILAQLEKLSKDTKSLEEWKVIHEAEYKQLKQLYDDVMSGNFPDEIKNAFTEWMTENAIDLVGEMATQVFFGINDQGYFVAYIPESWNDIKFGTTGLDVFISGYDYGHLTLTY